MEFHVFAALCIMSQMTVGSKDVPVVSNSNHRQMLIVNTATLLTNGGATSRVNHKITAGAISATACILHAMSYFEQKEATLRFEPDYDYFVGPNYPGRIPTSEHGNWPRDVYASHARENATHDALAHKNLPVSTQNLYAEHGDDQVPVGYYKWPHWRVALDVAPILLNVKQVQQGNIGDALAANAALPCYGLLNDSNARAIETPIVMPTPGWPLGLLFDAPLRRPQ